MRNDRFQHALHSPVSGKVTAFKKMWHASGKMVEMIEIQNDFEEKLDPSIKGLTNLTKQTIIETVKNAGVVGLGVVVSQLISNIYQKLQQKSLLLMQLNVNRILLLTICLSKKKRTSYYAVSHTL